MVSADLLIDSNGPGFDVTDRGDREVAVNIHRARHREIIVCRHIEDDIVKRHSTGIHPGNLVEDHRAGAGIHGAGRLGPAGAAVNLDRVLDGKGAPSLVDIDIG